MRYTRFPCSDRAIQTDLVSTRSQFDSSDWLITDEAQLDRDALFAELRPLIGRLAFQYGYTFELRQDLRGELYCLFHAFLDRYDPSRGIPLRPYLIKQLSMAAFTYARKFRRERQHETPFMDGDESGFASPDPTPEWDTLLVLRQSVSMLPALIKDLPPRQRQVVVWRYYEDRSFGEIARLMGVQQSSVRSLLRHGLNRLREQLEAKPRTRCLAS